MPAKEKIGITIGGGGGGLLYNHGSSVHGLLPICDNLGFRTRRMLAGIYYTGVPRLFGLRRTAPRLQNSVVRNCERNNSASSVPRGPADFLRIFR